MYADKIFRPIPKLFPNLKVLLQAIWKTKKGKIFILTISAIAAFFIVTFYLNITKYKCITGDCKNGFAKMQYRGDSYYEGYVKNSHPDGYGLFQNKEGHLYKGEWKHGVKHGKGIYRYPDGSSYSGFFLNNSKHGPGIFTWRDGTNLNVRWSEDEPNGSGILTLSDGMRLSGIYKNGRIFEGNGAFIYPNGNVYIGSWRLGKREGFGIFKDELGTILYKGNWKNDQEAPSGLKEDNKK